MALEVRWALVRAVDDLHAGICAAARRGVPLARLAEASSAEAGELRRVLGAAGSPAGPGRREPAPPSEAVPAPTCGCRPCPAGTGAGLDPA